MVTLPRPVAVPAEEMSNHGAFCPERNAAMQTTRFIVTGMTCGSCVVSVTSALERVDGVENFSVSLATGKATVSFDEQVTSADALQEAVRKAGYGAEIVPAAQSKSSGGGCCH